MAVSVRKGFREEDFARLHPGGKLGKRFLTVSELMHTGQEVPRVAADAIMKDVIYEMSRKGLGLATVQDDDGMLLGLITDGDLRRWMLESETPLRGTVEAAMTAAPLTIGTEALATEALFNIVPFSSGVEVWLDGVEVGRTGVDVGSGVEEGCAVSARVGAPVFAGASGVDAQPATSARTSQMVPSRSEMLLLFSLYISAWCRID